MYFIAFLHAHHIMQAIKYNFEFNLNKRFRSQICLFPECPLILLELNCCFSEVWEMAPLCMLTTAHARAHTRAPTLQQQRNLIAKLPIGG